MDERRLKPEELVQQHGEAAVLRDLSGYRDLVPDDRLRSVALRLAEDSRLTFKPAVSYGDGHLSTGVRSVDEALGGGLPAAPGGHLVELHGLAGSGKTQLCLQLCARGAAPAVYVATAGRFPYERYAAMAPPARRAATVVEHVRDVAALEGWAAHRLPWLLRQARDRRVVVVDSVAALYRPAFQRGAELERAASMRKVAAALKGAAAAVRGVVVCVNEVTSRPDSLPHRATVPALGKTWGSCCNTRLEVSRMREGTRRVRVMHSSVVALGTEAYFAINEGGLESVES